jgi:Tol biopolymer transport system component
VADPSVAAPSAAPRTPVDHDRLDSWKQIAAYLGRGVTTVQRWEQEEGLPVHRLPHAKKGSIFAFKRELDAWIASRARAAESPARTAPLVSPGIALRGWALAFVVIGCAAVAMLIWVTLVRRDRPESLRTALRVLPRPIESGGTPSLSPDGSHVVYARSMAGAQRVFIKPIGGGEARALPLSPEAGVATSGYPAWSPRGDLIAFLSIEAPPERGLFVVSSRGGMPRRLTGVTGIGLCWAPDGSRIAFADRASEGEPFSIFSASIEGGPRTRLTTPSRATFGDTFCAFSPDGRALAVVRHVTRYECHVHVVPLDSAGGSVSRQMTDSLNGIQGLAWTPDGREILAGASQGLWSISATTRAKPELVAGLEGGVSYPAFSRASAGGAARLVYQYHKRDVNVWRWSGDADAAGSARRITTSTWFEDLPTLSPDGSRLAFLSNQTAATQVWVSNADGSGARQLTFRHGPLALSPQWSPDGRSIAFSATVDGNRDIYVATVDGGAIERVTTAPSEEGNPSWSRDGQSMYFRSDRGGAARLWKVPRTGGEAIPVTKGEASQGFESPDGTVLYYVRSVPQSGLWSAPLSGGQETLMLPDVREGYWGVAERGIAYIPSEEREDGTFEVRFFDLATRTSSVLTTVQPPLKLLSPGFSVSWDGRTVYWTQFDSSQSDVMLIDPWHP